jgi:hypothetical protein
MNEPRLPVELQVSSDEVPRTVRQIIDDYLKAGQQIRYHKTYNGDQLNSEWAWVSVIANLQAVTPNSSAPFPRENWVKSPCKSK